MALLALGQSRKSDILVGAFVLAGLVLLGGWATIKILGPSLRGHEYFAYLNDVTGLKVGTPVLIGGYRTGLVTHISHRWASTESSSLFPANKDCETALPPENAPKPRPAFQLTLAVDRDWAITTDSQVRVDSPSLLGQPVVAITLGDGARLCPGSTLAFASGQSESPDLTDLTHNAGRVLATMQVLLTSLEQAGLPQQTTRLLSDAQQAVRQMADASTALKVFVDDPKLVATKAAMHRSASELTALLQDARRIAQEVHEVAPTVTSVMKEIRPPLSSAAVDLESTMRFTSARLPGIVADIERTAQDLSGLIADLRANPAGALRGRAAEAPVWTGEPDR